MHQKIYIVDDNYVLNSVKKLITIPGEIGLTIKVGLYTGLRQEEIVHLHKTALCTSLEGKYLLRIFSSYVNKQLTSAKQKHFLLCNIRKHFDRKCITFSRELLQPLLALVHHLPIANENFGLHFLSSLKLNSDS